MKAIFVGLLFFTLLLHGVLPSATAYLIGALMWLAFTVIGIIVATADGSPLVEKVDD